MLIKSQQPEDYAPPAERLKVALDKVTDTVIVPHRMAATFIQNAKGAPPAQKGQTMVAKIAGFARLASIVHDLNNNAGTVADALATQLQEEHGKIMQGMAAAKNNVDNVRATREGLDAFNAAFGNGGPPLDGSSG